MIEQKNYSENVVCPLCESNRGIRTNSRFGRYDFHEPDHVSVVMCKWCGLWMLTPRFPEREMIKLYQSGDYFHDGEGGYEDYEDQENSLYFTFRNFMRNVHRNAFVDGGLLEIGCAEGLLLKASSDLYKFRAGTDFSETSVEKSKAYADVVFLGGFDSVPCDYLIENNICTVVATNVIEHVYDPVAFVRSIYERMPKGGVLVLAAPDIGSTWRKVLGKRWPSFKTPEHVFYYTQKSLSTLMQKCGFDVTKPVSCPHYFPVKTIASKAGLSADRLPSFIANRSVKFYGIMTAVAGVK